MITGVATHFADTTMKPPDIPHRFIRKLASKLISSVIGRRMTRDIYDHSQKNYVNIKKTEWPNLFDHRLDVIIGSLYKHLSETNPSDFECMNQYIQVLKFAVQMPEFRVGLELGSGDSTVVLSKLISQKGGILYSVDYDTSEIAKRWGARRFQYISKYVRFISGSTISSEQIRAIYLNHSYRELNELGEITPSSLQPFIREYRGNYYKFLPTEIRDDQSKICQQFFQDGHFEIPVEFMDEEKLETYTNDIKNPQRDCVLQDLTNEHDLFDFVFFDSGEYSSLADWLLLKPHMNKGALIALHDIYYPKSVKNFLVAADIAADPAYQIMYIDQTTPQGLLIAQQL